MESRGISSIGAYVPAQRLSRQCISDAHAWLRPEAGTNVSGARAISDYDEDAITIAVEAARSALRRRDSESIESLIFASTTMPFADRKNSGVIAEAISLSRRLMTMDVGGSLGCALSALRQALEGRQDTLVVAADKRLARPGSAQELEYGDGGVALTISDEGSLAEYIGGYSLNIDMTDHYRRSESRFSYHLEERWVRDEGHVKLIPEAIRGLCAETGIAGAEIDHVVIAAASAATKRKIVAKSGIREEALCQFTDDDCGNIGSAHPFLMLGYALESARPGELVLIAGFAQGCEALLLRVTDCISGISERDWVSSALAGTRQSDDYLRYLSQNGLVELDWGIRAERDNRTAHSTFYRQRAALTGFMAGQCSNCKTVQYPLSRTCAASHCRTADSQVPYSLADEAASIASYTQDWLAHSRNPPFLYGNISFECGARVMMEMVGFPSESLKVGTPVKLVFRIKDQDPQRGFHRYFWKAAPKLPLHTPAS